MNRSETRRPIFSPEDSDLSERRWNFCRDGYARTTLTGKIRVLAHHMVSERAFGRKPDWGKREVIDHINRNKLDNRRENLRICQSWENTQNIDRGNPEFKYTTPYLGKFQVQIPMFAERRYLGIFDTQEEACAARNMAMDAIMETFNRIKKEVKKSKPTPPAP